LDKSDFDRANFQTVNDFVFYKKAIFMITKEIGRLDEDKSP
jgi:hypothetical protein